MREAKIYSYQAARQQTQVRAGGHMALLLCSRLGFEQTSLAVVTMLTVSVSIAIDESSELVILCMIPMQQQPSRSVHIILQQITYCYFHTQHVGQQPTLASTQRTSHDIAPTNSQTFSVAHRVTAWVAAVAWQLVEWPFTTSILEAAS